MPQVNLTTTSKGGKGGGTILISVLQLRKQRLVEVEQGVQVHTTNPVQRKGLP